MNPPRTHPSECFKDQPQQPAGMKKHSQEEPFQMPPLSPEKINALRQKQSPGQKRAPKNLLGQVVSTPLITTILGWAFLLPFIIICWVIFREFALVIDRILQWPTVFAWPVFGLITLGALFIAGYLLRILWQIHRLPSLPQIDLKKPFLYTGKQREDIKEDLKKYLQRLGRDDSPERSELASRARIIASEANNLPFDGWIRRYLTEIQEPLVKEVQQESQKIAIAAGVSVMISPWRFLDVLITFNALMELARRILTGVGIKAGKIAVMKFTLDAVATLLFALALEGVLEEGIESVSQGVGEVVGREVFTKLSARAGAATAVGLFIRRAGNRMALSLAPVRK